MARSLLCFVCLCTLLALPATAVELTVEPKQLRLTESLIVSVTLDGPFAAAEVDSIPVRNLRIEGSPSTSTEITWINGVLTRRKVLRFTARPLEPGKAFVGPLTLAGEDGARILLAEVMIDVLADPAAGTNDAAVILRSLMAAGRDPMFIVVEADRQKAYIGEQVVVTWTLYNAANIHRWQISRVPQLENFWVEELDVRDARPEQTIVAGFLVQKIPVRRAALYALRSGLHTIGPLGVEAAVLRRINNPPFGLFEGNLTEVRYDSAAMSLRIDPLPPAATTDLVGDTLMQCLPPVQRERGPILYDVSLSGRSNLRLASPPSWARPPAGRVEIIDRGVTSERREAAITMTRRWQYVIYPETSGVMSIPPLRTRVFNSLTGQEEEKRCEARPMLAQAVSLEATTTISPMSPGRAQPARRWSMGIGIAILAAISMAITMLALRKRIGQKRRTREVARADSIEELHARLEALFSDRQLDRTLLREEVSDRGDAYRGLESLVRSVETGRMTLEEAREEIVHRLRAVLSFRA